MSDIHVLTLTFSKKNEFRIPWDGVVDRGAVYIWWVQVIPTTFLVSDDTVRKQPSIYVVSCVVI